MSADDFAFTRIPLSDVPGYRTYWPARGWVAYRCRECGLRAVGPPEWCERKAAKHQARAHGTCWACGEPVWNRVDGSPRQHDHRRCEGKDEGHKIEREFVKHMSARELR